MLFLGAFLRIYGIEHESLWNDELGSWFRSSFESIKLVIDFCAQTDVHPPGYQIILYITERIFGDSEAALRIPSAIAGILSIPVVFFLGKILFSFREGLIAAACMSVLWCPVYYSQEARAYSILLLFSLLTTYFWITIFSFTENKKFIFRYRIPVYILTGIAASYVHYYGLLLIALQACAAGIISVQKRSFLPRCSLIYGLILAAYMPWVPAMLYQLSRGGAGWIPEPKIYSFMLYLRFLFNKSNILLFIVICLYGFLFLKIIFHARKNQLHSSERSRLYNIIFLLLWLIVPFTIVFTVSVISKPVLTNRNLIISLPSAYLLFACAITALPIKRTGQIFVTVSILIFALYNLFFEIDYFSRPHKEQFREAVEFVVENDHAYSNSVIIGYVWTTAHLNYYLKKNNSIKKVDFIAGRKQDIENVAEYLNHHNPRYVWYVAANRKPAPEFVDFLKQKLVLVTRTTFINAQVLLFKNR